MPGIDFLDKIVSARKEVIREKGYTMGAHVPPERTSPVVRFISDPFLICEIKRRSPSKGDIAPGLDATGQASLYSERGVRSVSVLTENAFFGGSLSDLMDVKKAFPHLSLLRKDFLFSKEDIDVSYRAGADAVLLIASILAKNELSALHSYAESLGMTVLVEVHGIEDIEKAKTIKPRLTGINSRDLKTFTNDTMFPLAAKREITWKTTLLFESGIHCEEDARVALGGGFDGLLVGEAVVRKPALIGDLIRAFGQKRKSFWGRLYAREKPFVKICGITNMEDARHAEANGADLLGFVLTDSVRKADVSLPGKLHDLPILKVGVVVTDGTQGSLDPKIRALLDEGLIDAIQLHGSEPPSACYELAFPYYKVLRLRTKADIDSICDYNCPRVLVDAYSKKGAGGTGENIPENFIAEAKLKKPLWLAGGLDASNVRQIIDRFSPELLDASSRLESTHGKKDHARVEAFIREIKRSKYF